MTTPGFDPFGDDQKTLVPLDSETSAMGEQSSGSSRSGSSDSATRPSGHRSPGRDSTAPAAKGADAPDAKTPDAKTPEGVQPLLVVVQNGKVTFSDPAVVLIDLDEVLVGVESDDVLGVLKTVATTRENEGRTALTDTLMAEMRTRLGL